MLSQKFIIFIILKKKLSYLMKKSIIFNETVWSSAAFSSRASNPRIGRGSQKQVRKAWDTAAWCVKHNQQQCYVKKQKVSNVIFAHTMTYDLSLSSYVLNFLYMPCLYIQAKPSFLSNPKFLYKASISPTSLVSQQQQNKQKIRPFFQDHDS